jgi:hypothetical protein
MRCEHCRFYEPIPEHEWKGACTIKLPPHLQEAANNYAWTTRADNECDLGQPKQGGAEE